MKRSNSVSLLSPCSFTKLYPATDSTSSGFTCPYAPIAGLEPSLSPFLLATAACPYCGRPGLTIGWSRGIRVACSLILSCRLTVTVSRIPHRRILHRRVVDYSRKEFLTQRLDRWPLRANCVSLAGVTVGWYKGWPGRSTELRCSQCGRNITDEQRVTSARVLPSRTNGRKRLRWGIMPASGVARSVTHGVEYAAERKGPAASYSQPQEARKRRQL